MRDYRGFFKKAADTGNVPDENVSELPEKVKLEEELRNRVRELEEFYEMAVGRELKMVELKNRIKELEHELKRLRTGISR